MAIAYPATNEMVGQAAASSHDIPLPTGIASGDLLCIVYSTGDTNRYLITPSGWDGEVHGNGGGTLKMTGRLHKIADGTEGATVTCSINTGTSGCAAVSFRATGFDAADPFNSDNHVFAEEATAENPWTVASGLLTGVSDSDSDIVLVGTASAARAITSQDSELTLIRSMTTGGSVHVLYEDAPGSSNAAYSNQMSDSRQWVNLLFEIKAAGGGSGPVLALGSFAA